ncbi:16789_t:CDS:2, partial [Cetraspora pellucida]
MDIQRIPTLFLASLYGGYAILQGVIGLIAVLGFSRRSSLIARVLVRTYVVIIILGAIRGSLMAWSIFYGQEHINWECNNGGKRWIDPSTIDPNVLQPVDTRLMPSTFCQVGLQSAA